jgi:hypothetical protein
MRAALRLVKSADKYLDGNGNTLVPPTNVNLLSMRGPSQWTRTQGNANVRFDTWSQSLVYDQPNTVYTVHTNSNGLGYNIVSWGKLQAGKNYTFSVIATGGPSLAVLLLSFYYYFYIIFIFIIICALLLVANSQSSSVFNFYFFFISLLKFCNF